MSQATDRLVARIIQGDQPALPDLIDQLERENDPRFSIIALRTHNTMVAIQQHKGDFAFTVAAWSQLTRFALHVMSPAYAEVLKKSGLLC